MKTTDVPPHLCPCCGALLEHSTCVTGETGPASGDPSLCWSCAGALIFGDDLRLRKMTAEERATTDAKFPQFSVFQRLRATQIAVEATLAPPVPTQSH